MPRHTEAGMDGIWLQTEIPAREARCPRDVNRAFRTVGLPR